MLQISRISLKLFFIGAVMMLFSTSFINPTAASPSINCFRGCVDYSGVVIHENRIIPGRPAETKNPNKQATDRKSPIPPSSKPAAENVGTDVISNWDCEFETRSRTDLKEKGIDPCSPTASTPTDKPQPAVPPQIIEEVRHLPFTKPKLVLQPFGEALLKMPELAYTPTSTSETLHATILGKQITVHAYTVGFDWHWGDGITSHSTDPGAPYPNDTVGHFYDKPGTYTLSLTITITATYTDENGITNDIPGVVTLTSKTQKLRVKEKHAVLVSGE